MYSELHSLKIGVDRESFLSAMESPFRYRVAAAPVCGST